ncbi:MAG: HAD family phosphatase, partial [Odoribacter sp.]|nr:HAD family phosphatase [Odoribacter sp.]
MKHVRKKAGLFDLDGVILNTEGQYSKFWEEQGKLKYPDMENFDLKIKGFTLNKILETYFPEKEEEKEIIEAVNRFESQMDMTYIPGVIDFIKNIRSKEYKTAVVTSSNNQKMENVYRAHPELKEMFDAIITADKITHSKPDPECYLLAAKELGIKPKNCFVFEDAFSGLQAGRAAGMKVIGLATTNPAEKIKD